MKKLISKVVTYALLLAMVVTAVVIPNATANADDTVKVHVWTDSSWGKCNLYC